MQDHLCNELYKYNKKDNFTEVVIGKDTNTGIWGMDISYTSDYYGDERSCDIKYCPFCGEKLE